MINFLTPNADHLQAFIATAAGHVTSFAELYGVLESGADFDQVNQAAAAAELIAAAARFHSAGAESERSRYRAEVEEENARYGASRAQAIARTDPGLLERAEEARTRALLAATATAVAESLSRRALRMANAQASMVEA